MNTCDLCDRFEGRVRVLELPLSDFGGRVAFSGLVSTVKALEDNSLVREAVAEAGNGRVLVVDGGGSLRRSMLGDMLAGKAVANGWAGVLVNGCVRDAAELAASAVGIRALALMPLPTEKRNEGQRDVAVQVQGVWVRVGDWLYADEDGVVVMPSPAG